MHNIFELYASLTIGFDSSVVDERLAKSVGQFLAVLVNDLFIIHFIRESAKIYHRMRVFIKHHDVGACEIHNWGGAHLLRILFCFSFCAFFNRFVMTCG